MTDFLARLADVALREVVEVEGEGAESLILEATELELLIDKSKPRF